MHDIRLIRENPQGFDTALARRGVAPQSEAILALDSARRGDHAVAHAQLVLGDEVGEVEVLLADGGERVAQLAVARGRLLHDGPAHLLLCGERLERLCVERRVREPLARG
jgi:hypothetical protein